MVLKSEIQNINQVEKLIDELSSKYNLNSDIYGKLVLAVVEGVNNAIVHGNKMVVEKDITVDYTVNDNAIEFYITDSGNGFDFNNIPDPTKPENIEKTHGRGIFLMNHLADEMEFIEPGNKVKMVFYLNK
jgi:serine/threonine-protein kinase RsbW